MLKNKRIIGLLVGVCILLCSIVILTMSADKAKEDNLPDTSISNIDKSDTENKETTDDSKINPKTDTNTDISSNKNTQTSPKEEKLPSQDSNQSQTNTETNTPSTPESTTEYVYVSIDCKTILNNMDNIPEKYKQYKQYVPSNGIILSSKKVRLSKGDTVFDIITKVTKMNKIQMSQSAGYIQSIHNLPEKLFNGSGGWMYSVNGSYADRGSKEYKLKNNDKIEWRYTCYIGDLKE